MTSTIAEKKSKADSPLAAEITVPLEPTKLRRVLTKERLRVLQVAREEPMAVAQLARRLKRDTRAVSRDVDLLEKLGLVLDVGYDKNPGHGLRRVVRPAAKKIRLIVTV